MRRQQPLQLPPRPAWIGDPLACLRERDGWREAEGGGWTNPSLKVTVKQAGVYGAHRGFVVVDHDTDTTRTATSATGALCILDTIMRRTAEPT